MDWVRNRLIYISISLIGLLIVGNTFISCSTSADGIDVLNELSSSSENDSNIESSSDKSVVSSIASSEQSSSIDDWSSGVVDDDSSLDEDQSSSSSLSSEVEVVSSEVDQSSGVSSSDESSVVSSSLKLQVSSDSGPQWETLFNGQDLTHWSIKAHADDLGDNYFYVEDGAIVADAYDADHDYVWCYSDKEYSDFHLKLKFQGERGDNANSGVQVQSRYDHNDTGGWLNGPQIDIGFTGRNGSIWDETRNNQTWLYKDSSDKPLVWSDEDEGWNNLEVIVNGVNIVAIQNGDTITDYDGAGVLDDQNHKNLNVGVRGHIALQIHTGDIMKIRFKDIEILDLSEPLPPPLKVLVFGKIAGFFHPGIPTTEEAIVEEGELRNWDVTLTRDSDLFTLAGLDTFDVVVWNNNCSDSALLVKSEMDAFEDYIEGGGGYVGFHGTAWSHYEWDWYVDTLLAAMEINKNGTWEGVWNDEALVLVEVDNALTNMVPDGQVWNDEYYAMDPAPRGKTYAGRPNDDIEILMSAIVDWEYGDFKTGHPFIWRHTVLQGRMWYTGIGHNDPTINDPIFRNVFSAGIEWAGGRLDVP